MPAEAWRVVSAAWVMTMASERAQPHLWPIVAGGAGGPVWSNCTFSEKLDVYLWICDLPDLTMLLTNSY